MLDALVQEFGHATFWVMIALFIFIGGVIYLGVHKKVFAMLDDRADGIRKEIEEARTLREEAQTLLASYQRKQRDAEAEAEELVAQARHEAEQMAKEAEAQIAEQIARSTAMAEQKIKSAEAQAVAEVQAIAADVAVAAAAKVLADTMGDAKTDQLIKDSIDGLKGKIH